MQRILLIAALAATLIMACDTAHRYPQSRRDESVATDFFGTNVSDPYRWLEDETSAETKQWVDAQNTITFGYLGSLVQRDSLRRKLEHIWNYPKYTTPFHEGESYFFFKNNGLQPQSVLYRQKGLEGQPEVFLDPNTFSKDGTVSLTVFDVSNDHKYAVFGKSDGGSDWNEFFVMDLATGKQLADHVKWVKFSGAAWYKDGFYYGRFPEPKGGKALSEANQNQRIYYHKVGTDQSADKLIFEYPQDPNRGISAFTSEDERFLFLSFSQGASENNALSYQEAGKGGAFAPLVTNFENSYDVITNLGDKFLLVTNQGAPRKRVVLMDPKNPAPANWQEIIPQQAKAVIEGASVVGDKLFVRFLVDVSSKINVYDLSGKQLGEVALPGPGIVESFGGKRADTEIFYTFTSFTYPPTIFRYDIASNTSKIYRKSEVTFNPDQYITEQVFYPSKDGTKIPMFITYKKGLKRDGGNPTMLYAYGGFNVNILPSFSIARLPFLEAGGVYAQPSLRGGGEYGEEWHQAGMLNNKQNVFDDFIAAAEYLINEKYTSSKKLAISGGSNGGLLVGAVMAQRPELYAVAVPRVGVMDMLRYHRFTIGHAWVVEYGCADSTKQEFETLYKYSPLHNMKPGTEYPATLVMTADHDDRVVPAHSYKFAAALQHAHKGNNPVMIRIDTKAGHGAGKSTQQTIEESADMWAFVFQQLGIEL